MLDPHDNPYNGHPSLLAGRPISRTLIVISIVIALGAHVGLTAFIFYLTHLGQQKLEKTIEPKMLRFEDVELLTLGEEKPKNAMPQIANPPPPKAIPAPPKNVEPKPELPKVPEPQKPVEDQADEPEELKPDEVQIKPKEGSVEKKEEKTKTETTPPPEQVGEQRDDSNKPDDDLLDALSSLHNPDRPVNDVIPEGSVEGVVGGTTSNAALANMMNTYQAKLLQELAKTWQLPTTLSREEISALAGKVSAYVRISSSGNIISYRFLKTSGNTAFDSSIDRVLRKYTVQGGRKLPLPKDSSIKETVLKQGLTLSDWRSIQN